MEKRPIKRVDLVLPVVVFILMAILHPSLSLAAPTASPPLSKQEIMHMGENIYRNGVLPSGKSVKASIRGDVEVDGAAFSCSSCHLRAGLGSFEGGVVTPPTTGKKLYNSYRRPPSLGDVADSAGRYIYAKTIQERPAYTRETLSAALRSGVDPADQIFNDVMPRYQLSDQDMAILISYLEELSLHYSPGASRNELALATVISDDVNQEDRQAMLQPLQHFVAHSVNQFEMFNDYKRFGYVPTAEMKYAFRKVTLDVWELKGPPETWRSQLDAYYAKKPVFALLGGISNNDWKAVHDFCEEQRIPSLFPITDLPVISESGWYTYYFSKGYAQEGEAVARFINRSDDFTAESSILQIVEKSAIGKALASGFDLTWKELGRTGKVHTEMVTASQLQSTTALTELVKKHKPAIVLVWSGADIVPALPALVSGDSAPRSVFMSSSYLGKSTAAIDETLREKVYLTYPYRLTPFVGSNNSSFDAKVPILTTSKSFGDRRIGSRITTMLKQTAMRAFNLLNDNLHRDHLLDIMSMQMDLVALDYERLSFGPGQRYISKGCYIIQLGPGSTPDISPRSEWVLH